MRKIPIVRTSVRTKGIENSRKRIKNKWEFARTYNKNSTEIKLKIFLKIDLIWQD